MMRWSSISRVSTFWFVKLDCNERAIVSLPTPGNPFNMTRQPEDLGSWVSIVRECGTTATLLKRHTELVLPQNSTEWD